MGRLAMDPGERRHYLEFKKRPDDPPVDPDFGGSRDTRDSWPLFSRAWGKVETLTGREFDQAQQQVAHATHRVTVPALDAGDVTPGMFLDYKGRKLNIGWINDVEGRERLLILLCGEKVAN